MRPDAPVAVPPPPAAASLALSRSVVIFGTPFEADTLSVAVVDQYGRPMDVEVIWSSADPEVATVSVGIVTPTGPGRTHVRAAVSGYPSVRDSVPVVSYDPPVPSGIEITPDLLRYRSPERDSLRRVGRDGFSAAVFDQYERAMPTQPEWRVTGGDYDTEHGPRHVRSWLTRTGVFVVDASGLPPPGSDPVYAPVVARVGNVADTATFMIPSRLLWRTPEMSVPRDYPFPVRLAAGGAHTLDMNGWYESAKGLPIAYRLKPFMSWPNYGDSEQAREHLRVTEVARNVFSIEALRGDVWIGFGFTGDTETEHVTTSGPRSLLVGEIPCPRRPPPAESEPLLDVVWQSDDVSPCVRGLFNDAAAWWSAAVGADGHAGIVVDVDVERTALGGPLAYAAGWDETGRGGLPNRGVVGLADGIFGGWWWHPDTALLYETIRHELGHVLGVGMARWNDLMRDEPTPHFGEEAARAAFRHLGFRCDCDTVPIDPDSRAHWHREVLANEMMNPYYRPSGMFVTEVTLGALADLGWAVDMNMAEEYAPSARAIAGRAAPPIPFHGPMPPEHLPGRLRPPPGTPNRPR